MLQVSRVMISLGTGFYGLAIGGQQKIWSWLYTDVETIIFIMKFSTKRFLRSLHVVSDTNVKTNLLCDTVQRSGRDLLLAGQARYHLLLCASTTNTRFRQNCDVVTTWGVKHSSTFAFDGLLWTASMGCLFVAPTVVEDCGRELLPICSLVLRCCFVGFYKGV